MRTTYPLPVTLPDAKSAGLSLVHFVMFDNMSELRDGKKDNLRMPSTMTDPDSNVKSMTKTEECDLITRLQDASPSIN
jgi:hypothetical protein